MIKRANDHEVESHFFQEIERVSIIFDNFDQVIKTLIMRSEVANNAV